MDASWGASIVFINKCYLPSIFDKTGMYGKSDYQILKELLPDGLFLLAEISKDLLSFHLEN